MTELIGPPIVPFGRIKTFGPDGPMYEVGPALRQMDDGDWMIEITLVESGETTEYRLKNLLEDPYAR